MEFVSSRVAYVRLKSIVKASLVDFVALGRVAEYIRFGDNKITE